MRGSISRASHGVALACGVAGFLCLTACPAPVVPPPVVPATEFPDEPPPPPPDPDPDRDGVLGDADPCPTLPEDPDGHQDGDGCPEPELDMDGDTILDENDRCPGDAEVVNGVDDTDGCPDEAQARVVEDRIVLEDTLQFEFGTAVLRGESLPVLQDVADLLLAHPEYERVSIEGHSDYQGPEESNQRLSERRAERVRETLIRMGVEPERLTSIGYGTSQPLVPGRSLAANRQNRRVEFVIVQTRNP